LKTLPQKVGFLIVILAICIPIFSSLSSLPIRDFDEARNSISALEMEANHDYLVTHYDGQPDMWSTKPPLMIWMQVASLHLFGKSEFAIRFPSAMAGLFTCILILFFFTHYIKKPLLGVLSVLVLTTSEGYVGYHSTRTGDFDALLALFMFGYCISYFLYSERKELKYLISFFILLFLATFTKGIQGLLFTPALFIFSLLSKDLKFLLSRRSFYVLLFLFIGSTISFYLLRNHYNPGYINAVFENEIGGRYLSTIENHSGGFWYYLFCLKDFQLKFWYLLVPFGIILGLFEKNPGLKRFFTFTSLCSVTYFIIISTSKTKCAWYDVPMFPFLSILISLCLYQIIHIWKSDRLIAYRRFGIAFSFAFVGLLLYEPIRTIVKKTVNPKEEKWDENKYEIGHFLQAAVAGKHDLNNMLLVHEGYATHNLFYLRLLNDKGVNISFAKVGDLKKGQAVIVHQADQDSILKKNFYTTQISAHKNVEVFRIDSIKKSDNPVTIHPVY
jgi:4-amino-4-deoxy-L-arabinose transferase-like glycosyltransferase